MGEPNIADLTRTMEALLDRLDRHHDGCPFDASEIEKIRRAARLVEWFDTLGWIGKQLMGLTAAGVLLISQWDRIVAWIRGVGQ